MLDGRVIDLENFQILQIKIFSMECGLLSNKKPVLFFAPAQVFLAASNR